MNQQMQQNIQSYFDGLPGIFDLDHSNIEAYLDRNKGELLNFKIIEQCWRELSDQQKLILTLSHSSSRSLFPVAARLNFTFNSVEYILCLSYYHHIKPGHYFELNGKQLAEFKLEITQWSKQYEAVIKTVSALYRKNKPKLFLVE